MPPRPVFPGWAEVAAQFGEKVRVLREDQGMTQEQLAHRANLSRNQVQNIERSRNNNKDSAGRPGPGNPRMDTVFAIAAALGIEVTYLVDPSLTEAAKRPSSRQ